MGRGLILDLRHLGRAGIQHGQPRHCHCLAVAEGTVAGIMCAKFSSWVEMPAHRVLSYLYFHFRH